MPDDEKNNDQSTNNEVENIKELGVTDVLGHIKNPRGDRKSVV